MFIDIDSPEGAALFDALLDTNYDERLDRVYNSIGLVPDDNNMMNLIP